MKKLYLSLGLMAALAMHASGQGTIQFANNTFSRVQFLDLLGGSLPVIPFHVAVYYAATPGAWQGPVMPFGSSVGSAGLFTAPNGGAYQIPGTEPDQIVYMQIYAWTAAEGADPYQAWQAGAGTVITDVRQVQLASASGPGTIIWQGDAGTNPNQFTPLTFWNNGFGGPPPPVVPEPSTLTLGALGGMLLLFRFRKSVRK